MLGVPARLARDRLDDVREDLGQRVVAADRPERVRQRRIGAGVVERMAGLVQECGVVVQPAHGARDQVDDRRWIGRDHTGPRGLLRPVVEVEPDARVVLDREPDRVQAGRADGHRTLLRVRVRERRQPSASRRRGRTLGTSSRSAPSSRSSQRSRSGVHAPSSRRSSRATTASTSRSETPLTSSFRATASGSPESSAFELVPRREQRAPLLVEARRRRRALARRARRVPRSPASSRASPAPSAAAAPLPPTRRGPRAARSRARPRGR